MYQLYLGRMLEGTLGLFKLGNYDMSASNTTESALLIDLDGVLYQGDRIIRGAVETMNWIQAQGISHLFVTNTTSRSRSSLLKKFDRLGLKVNIEDIVTPICATSSWLKSKRIERIALFIPAEAEQDFNDIEIIDSKAESGVEAVVIGDLGDKWNFATLNRAFRLLMQTPQPLLIALGMTRFWRASDGLRLDVAPFVKALEHASGAKATVIGKPSTTFFNSALSLLQRKPCDTVMIGDDIVGDIQGAQQAGMRAILVKTGKFRSQDLQGEITPDGLLESIASLPAWWAKSESLQAI